jgi:hypothetical protein
MSRFPTRPGTVRPASSSLTVSLCGGLLVLAGYMVVSFLARPLVGDRPQQPQPATTATPTPAPPPIDTAAVRARAWAKAGPLLAAADQEIAAALNKHLAAIPRFLDERQAGVRAFAERLTGLRGKWEILKAQVASDGDQDYAQFLADEFAEHVFRDDDLQRVVESAIRGFLSELEAIEARLLVRLRADLADDALQKIVIPALRSDAELHRQFRGLSVRLASTMTTDLALTAGRELLLWQGGNLVGNLALRAAAGVAGRLGASGAILAAGASSSWASFGVSIAAAWVLDQILTQILKAAGYDAEDQVVAHVTDMLGGLGRRLTNGNPDADIPGLRAELRKLAAARATLRRQALHQLFYSEVTP